MRQLRDPRATFPEADSASSTLLAAADEEIRERRVLRAAVAVAVAFHLLAALVPMPKAAAVEEAEPERARLIVVQTPRFKPPVIPPEPVVPEHKPFVVPVPDPTPDEPEPIRPLEVVAPELEPPEIGIVGEIPPPPPLPDGGPIEIGGPVTRPVPIDTPQPIYSEIARRARIEGVVLLRTILDTSGRVTDVKIVKDLPFGLGAAAVAAVERWRYRPATLNSEPVAVYLEVTVRFTLQ
jgi:periplasmic protein TonB